jgi:hypothetical protein
MSVRVILSKKFAQVEPVPEETAPEAAQSQPQDPKTKDTWIELGNVIEQLNAYYNKQHNNGDKIAISVNEDDKNKKFTITITKSDMIKSPAAPQATASKKLQQIKIASKALSAYPKEFLKSMGF